MKVHTFIRDIHQMQLAELKAIDLRAKAVQAKDTINDAEQSSLSATQTSSQKTRKKTEKKKIRGNKDRVLPET